MTRQRKAIMEIVQSSDDHLTAEQILILARDVMPSISIATVYRNLNRMVQEGEIGRVSVADAPDRFDKMTVPHGHMICDSCGKIFDMLFTGIEDFLKEQTGVPIVSYDISVHCICSECMERWTDGR